MEFETLHFHLKAKPGATEEYPFGEDAMVFKVGGKMFALFAFQETPLRVTLKCDPQEAEALREMYASVQPGYYMNKSHWNTITIDGEVPDDEIIAMTDASYALVRSSLTKAQRESLAG